MVKEALRDSPVRITFAKAELDMWIAPCGSPKRHF
jgi:hypothetical protein